MWLHLKKALIVLLLSVLRGPLVDVSADEPVKKQTVVQVWFMAEVSASAFQRSPTSTGFGWRPRRLRRGCELGNRM